MRILIIGGYGTFGGRLVELLADEPRLTLIVAGRSVATAQDFCRRPAKARLVPAHFDRTASIETQLRHLEPQLVVDASGPFQAYQGDAYAVVRAALATGADYLDLADAAAFATGIASLDAEARRQDRFALSGVSSFPVLTAAAVRHLGAGLETVDQIVGGIAPSPFAGVGLNVIRAIASYTGKPVTIIDNGKRTTRTGFVDSRTLTVNVPGRVPLPPLRFALVEVPDLTVLAEEWPGAQTVWMGAGRTPALLHRLLWLAAWLVHLRLLPALVPLAPIMHRVVNAARWGEHRGGMTVVVSGKRVTGPEVRSWHLVADGDAGPLIPSMAAEVIIRRCLNGIRPRPGARPGHRDMELADYEVAFARHGISTGVRTLDGKSTTRPLYERIMGPAFGRLAEPIQQLHDVKGSRRYAGRATVTRGSGWLANAIASLFGFPSAMSDAPVHVVLTDTDGVERWQRQFKGQRFVSTQAAGTGRFDGLLVERFGPLAFGLAVTEDSGRLSLIPRRWSAFGVPMPMRLAPNAVAGEHAAEGRFHFSVAITLPIIGSLVRYRGWLEPEPARDAADQPATC